MAYGAVLKNLRESTTDMSQEQLAEASGVSREYLSKLERALRCPSLVIFIRNSIAMNNDPVLVLSMVMRRLRREP
jgi:transcriptional regulator with XRE-family HTH domain